jgi:hypothetical protein
MGPSAINGFSNNPIINHKTIIKIRRTFSLFNNIRIYLPILQVVHNIRKNPNKKIKATADLISEVRTAIAIKKINLVRGSNL